MVADDHMVNQFDFQELPGANEVARHLDVGLRRGAFPTSNGRELHEIDREALMQRTGYERSNIRQKWCGLLESLVEPLTRDDPESPLR